MSSRNLGALALLVAASSTAFAQGEPGLVLPRTTRTQATTGAQGQGQAQGPGRNESGRRVDLRGEWSGEHAGDATHQPKNAAVHTPGSFRFRRTRRERAQDSYGIHMVSSAQDESLRTGDVSATFDGQRLTITWMPTAGVNGRIAVLGATVAPPTVRTIVYTHSSDDDFDRLALSSGTELPNGIPAPRELRRLKPPQVEFPAEWETSQEILWGYQNEFSISLIYQAAVRGCAANGESVKHRFYVATEESERQLRFELASALGPRVMSRLVTFHRYDFGSVWMRDYGPWTVRMKRDHRLAAGDMHYFSERENDDGLPADYARLRGWERLDLSALHIEGGNIMSDGHGKLFTTTRTLEGAEADANDEQDDVEANLRRVGASSVHFFERMPEPEGTGHIDMFAKLMDERTVLVGRHHEQAYATVLDRNAARFSALGYRVERVDFARPDQVTQVGRRGLGLMTYTNSLFVGRTVLVTQYHDAERDRAALETYRRLGWRPVGIDVRSIIAANGAIHCVTMQVPAR
ncbi:MAG: agmatine deiminase family protein [Planctomycetota bacterium]